MNTHVNTKTHDDLVWRHYQEALLFNEFPCEVLKEMQELVREDMWIVDNTLFRNICESLEENMWF